MKTLFLILCCVYLSGCYIALVEQVTETIPMQPDSPEFYEVLKQAYAAKYTNVQVSPSGAVSIPFIGADPDLSILREILGIEGLVKELAGVIKPTIATVAHDEVTKNEFWPYKIRQVNSWVKIGTGKRELGQVGDITVPLEIKK